MPKPVFITNYFTTTGECFDRVSSCNFCDQVYNRPTGSTGSLRNHLSSKHHEQFMELLELERSGAEMQLLKKQEQKAAREADFLTQSKLHLFCFSSKYILLWCFFAKTYNFMLFSSKYLLLWHLFAKILFLFSFRVNIY